MERTCDNCKHRPEWSFCWTAERNIGEPCDKWEDLFDDRSDAEKRDDARLERAKLMDGFLDD